MAKPLHPLVSPFKRQLAQLQERHVQGTLTKTQLAQETAALERRLLDLLLHNTPADGAADAPGKTPPGLLAALALAIVLVAGAGYWYTGATGREDAAASEEAGQAGSAAQVVAMVDKLAERLQQNPDDGEGWAMLARSYSVMERNEDALKAYARALALRKDDASLLVDYADALAVKNQHSLTGEPMALIQRALKLEPNNLKGLALAGTDAFIRKDYALAVRYWAQVESIGPPENALVQRVASSLQEARSLANGAPPPAPEPVGTSGPLSPPAPTAASGAAATKPGAANASVSGTVSLSAALRAQVSPTDTVFIFARPADSRMPLAAERKQVKDLPYAFTLDDSKSMSPAARLSSAAQVVVGARISKSGDAIPQPGDFSGLSAPVALGTQGIALEIKDTVK
jgi:cytochrome c-type biogenesis protein CcmH